MIIVIITHINSNSNFVTAYTYEKKVKKQKHTKPKDSKAAKEKQSKNSSREHRPLSPNSTLCRPPTLYLPHQEQIERRNSPVTSRAELLLTPRRCTDDHSASVAELMTNNDAPVLAKLQGDGEFDGRRIIYHFIHTIYPYMEACTLAM